MPTPGEPLSGNEGTIKKDGAEFEITHWTFSGVTEVHSYVSNFTGPAKKTEFGNEIATGTIEGKRTSDSPIEDTLKNGDTCVAFFGFTPTTGITATIKVSQVDHDVNLDTGEMQTFSLNFTTSGTWSYS